jgi:uncharacterized protein YifN (PemK superfamily)
MFAASSGWSLPMMKIKFTPLRGHILMCDYDMANIPPEMDKVRRCVVISPRSYNGPHGKGAGRILVIPFSMTPAEKPNPSDVFFKVGPYKSLTEDVWGVCSAIMSVSHSRLDRVKVYPHALTRRPPYFVTELVSSADMARIEDGLRHATGTVVPPSVPSPSVKTA